MLPSGLGRPSSYDKLVFDLSNRAREAFMLDTAGLDTMPVATPPNLQQSIPGWQAAKLVRRTDCGPRHATLAGGPILTMTRQNTSVHSSCQVLRMVFFRAER